MCAIFSLKSENGSTHHGVYVIVDGMSELRHHGNALIPHKSETKDGNLPHKIALSSSIFKSNSFDNMIIESKIMQP